ncbi:MAG: LCP family protein [Actinomycetota bacterium]
MRIAPDPSRRRRTALAAMALASSLLAVGSAAGLGLYLLAESSRVTIPVETGDAFDITGTCAAESCTYLLLGSDSREGLSAEQIERFGDDAAIGGENRSDTIILVRTEPDAQRATFLSFPRDLWVDIPGVGEDRINAAFEQGILGGGAQLVARTITALTGIPIDHVLYVSLAGFEGVVDAIGGVDLCLPEPMTDPLTALDLPAGCQRLDGDQALAYVRTRHQPCDRIPDFARIARQQQFLRAVIARMLAPDEVLQLPSLLPDVLGNLVVDEALNPAELAYLADRLRGAGAGNADFRVVPTYPAWEGEKSVLKPIEPDATNLYRKLRRGRPLGDLGKLSLDTPPSPAVVAVSVHALDATTAGDGPTTAFELLVRSGFAVGPEILGAFPVALDRPTPVNGATVLFDPTSRTGPQMARVVRRFLRAGTVVAAPPGSLPEGTDVAVVVGPTFRPGPPLAPGDCLDP